MHARVAHHPRRQLHVLAQPLEVRREQAHLVGQLLGVHRPAFAVTRVPEQARDRMRLRPLLRDRRLHVVPGHGLVEGHGLELRAILFLRLVQRDRIGARTRAVRRGGDVMRHAVLLVERGNRLDADLGLGHEPEEFGQREGRAIDRLLRKRLDLSPRLEMVVLVLLERRAERRQIRGAVDLLHQRTRLGLPRGHRALALLEHGLGRRVEPGSKRSLPRMPRPRVLPLLAGHLDDFLDGAERPRDRSCSGRVGRLSMVRRPSRAPSRGTRPSGIRGTGARQAAPHRRAASPTGS